MGTHVGAEVEARAAADAALDALRRIHDERLDSNLSLKLTQIGLDVDEGLCREQLQRVFDCASRLGNFVCIDMEESPYVERTIRLFEEMRGIHGADTVGIVLQSYLRNRRSDLERLLAGARESASSRAATGSPWRDRISQEGRHRRRLPAGHATAALARAASGDRDARSTSH